MESKEDPKKLSEEAQASNETDTSDKVTQDGSPVARPIVEIPDAIFQEYRASQKRQDRENKVNRRVAIAAALSAWVYVGVATFQWVVMRGQLAEMRGSSADTKALAQAAKQQAEGIQALAVATQRAVADAQDRFVQDQRPYIWVYEVFDLRLEAGKRATWGVRYANFGRAPAVGVQVRSQIVFGKDGGKKVYPELFEKRFSPGQKPKGTIIVPRDMSNWTTALSQEILTQEDVTYIHHTDDGLLLFVHFEYFDTSGHLYSTEVCRFTLRSSAVGHCDEHNGVY